MKFFFVLIFVQIINAQRHPVVTTTEGQVKGIRQYSGLFHTFYSFKGIPYAEPPIKELRFRNPIPAKKWTGIRDGTKHGNFCPSDGILGFDGGGDEDCLYLNVYTPSLTGVKKAVMFWIHGGGYIIGNGNSAVYGPDLIVRENVTIVTINYRLSSLGFLSTEDENAQGNYGLKDMVMALKWVQRNIVNFNGDPNQVTIFGQSAGSSSVHYLLLSDMSKGLFKQAIMQSGTALSPFAFQPNPLIRAEELGRNLNLVFDSTKELVDQLRKIPFKEIMKAERILFDMDKPLGLRSFDFVPSVESNNSREETFLTDFPINLMLNGSYQDVPMIIGTTNNEGLLMLREYLLDNSVFDRYNENDYFLVPLSFELDENSTEVRNISDTFKKLYFDGQNLSMSNLEGWAEYHTDAQFRFPTDRTIKMLTKTFKNPIFKYEFGYNGALNILKKLLFLGKYPGACHADDLFYLFSPEISIPVWPTEHALTVRKRLIRLWTNFAKTGNPTTSFDALVNINWPKYSIDDRKFMQIEADMNVTKFYSERLEVWNNFQKQFTGHN